MTELGTTANARTGNEPMPRTVARIAKNGNAVPASASRFVRCSTIGIPVRSRIV